MTAAASRTKVEQTGVPRANVASITALGNAVVGTDTTIGGNVRNAVRRLLLTFLLFAGGIASYNCS